MEKPTKLLIVKWLHTIIWVIFVTFIFYIIFSGITGNITNWTWISVGMIVLEGLILWIFKYFCPLTLIARKYSDSNKHNFDIFLPEWLAKYNKVIFTTLFIIGLILVIIRTLC